MNNEELSRVLEILKIWWNEESMKEVERRKPQSKSGTHIQKGRHKQVRKLQANLTT